MVVPSIWSISLPSAGKAQVRMTRKGCVKKLDPKVQWWGVMSGIFGTPFTIIGLFERTHIFS
jgi:hypothetical protein